MRMRIGRLRIFSGATTTVSWTPPSCVFTTQAPTTTLVKKRHRHRFDTITQSPQHHHQLSALVLPSRWSCNMSDWYRYNHPPNPVSPPELAGQDPDERADKAEDDMWYVLQENDELKAKIEVQRWICHLQSCF